MLFLIPAYLSEESPKEYFAPIIKDYILKTDYFFVENEKTARKVIKFFCPEKKQSDLKLFLLNKHSEEKDLQEAMLLMKQGTDFGLLSEAGLPCIADPGNIMVKWAHQNDIQVVPISGPSSIILALISSGFNGQNFTFNGYLPIDKVERKKQILFLEQQVQKTGYTQIFMETPYRNNQLLEDLCKFLNPNTKLCVAANVTHPSEEFIKTKEIKNWKKEKPDLHKIPAVFVIGITR
ncbi:SAM-dependent methyltransferase [Riemerella anatipestifer]|uniref:Putative methyltransferase n=1 Tax=Riemerella anatipestifer RA-CH-1 TaxID=1228997 RepID=J9R5N2_RIEAN|nr:SAM-dependent methyltransferase [Riemerella anatipestifer]AFR36694.1 putative methyltransferase [Riemerella anatipestifer RA-CH-1]AIH01494.1 uroporphyrin-iii c/tetrapyrrole (corrin/porphyrin) methyltransferase [Riemerella anatipestifer CH3]MCO7331275.1 SAM-dependent methyltransferase [Riemerella anatipestifer]MCO7350254.1 SAM-dependent methyltransferase [Riemerella anatipestifer]MCU7582071.1 SAM-dependent methyltransferase [Riemerella anatipestifer]